MTALHKGGIETSILSREKNPRRLLWDGGRTKATARTGIPVPGGAVSKRLLSRQILGSLLVLKD